ncbi:DUF805 domain-containing protein [Streptomyces sp. NPDC008238]
MHWYLDVLRKYAVFGGRARRTEYWMFALVNLVISIVLLFVGRAIGFDYLQSVYALAVLLPTLGVSVRRLHDTGRSGWWLLIGLVPFLGAIVLLVFFCIEGGPSENEYGANPKFSGAPA